MSENNSAPLHQRTHFRRIREIMICIAKYENINPRDYDLSKIRAYECFGQELQGKNVSYNTHNGRSPWVSDNKYEIFEAPLLSNSGNGPYGGFLFLARNTSFDYYVFGTMRVNLQEEDTILNERLIESVSFYTTGKYQISYYNNDDHISKYEKGSKFDPGRPSSEVSFPFDSYNSRKKYGYRTDVEKILKSLGFRTNKKRLVDTDRVQIYRKKKSTNKNHNNRSSKKKDDGYYF